MYGLPLDINLTFFTGKALSQACFGVHDLILSFDDDIGITITSSISYSYAGESILQTKEFCKAALAITSLLNRVVHHVQGDVTGTLTITFEDGAILQVYDDSTQYESYVIRNGQQLIIV